jgi:hypothetical protein
MNQISHLRGIPALRPLRGHHPAVVVCLDAKLVVEREPGDLSARLGRPSVTVCDRFLEVELHAPDIAPEEAVKTVRWLEIRCEECPQSRVDMAPRGAPA